MKRHVDAIDLLLGAMSEIVREDAPDSAKAEMTDGIVRCVGILYEQISKPVAHVYPDLHPDKTP